ncbi:two-component system response regulator CreB [Moraxella sp. ZY21109]|nr:two-component system response regulator CreB [Moraxella sp. ZY210820]
MSKHILYVEDEQAIVLPLRYALEREGWQVTWVAQGQQALDICRQQHFDFIILDVGLPDMNGFELCKQLRQFCQTPLLFLTARDDEIDRIIGLEIGADDYCPKPFSAREIISRIKAIWRRMERPILSDGNQQASTLLWQMIPERLQIYYHGELLYLTRYEYGLLAYFIAHPEQIFSRQQLMNAVWENPDHSLERTIDTHIKSLRQKIKQITPDDEQIMTYRGVGYALKKY